MVVLIRILGIAALSALLTTACGDDDGGDVPDAAIADARLGADSSDMENDAGNVTACGEVPDQLECATATELCILTDTGGSLQPSCEVCDQDTRDCASCGSLCAGLTCADRNEANTIECF